MRRDFFSVRDITGMIGVGPKFVRNAIKSGRLRSHKFGHSRRVARHEFVDWLLRGGFPLEAVRSALNPDGAVILVRCRYELFKALRPADPLGVRSLFDLGRVVAETSAWGVVVDLAACGTDESGRSLQALSAKADRPLLVGLHGDDGAGDPSVSLACSVFDALIPAANPPEVLARSILRLRPRAKAKDL